MFTFSEQWLFFISLRIYVKHYKMETLKYKVIKTHEQYKEYSGILEEMIERSDPEAQEEIELLTLLIWRWEQDHNSFIDSNPVELLKSLMKDHQLKSKDLVEILGVSKGLVSDILNYRKGLSKEIIRMLSSHFKISQEAFNRPYKLNI
jgi:HTH-type transcriptional regulator / antitoxin HigA